MRKPIVEFSNNGTLIYHYPRFYKVEQLIYRNRCRVGGFFIGIGGLILPDCPFRTNILRARGKRT